MHQLGLTAADVAAYLHQETQQLAHRIKALEDSNVAAGMSPEAARQIALVHYLQAFTGALLEANNTRIAADLVKLGVLSGTLSRSGEASF